MQMTINEFGQQVCNGRLVGVPGRDLIGRIAQRAACRHSVVIIVTESSPGGRGLGPIRGGLFGSITQRCTSGCFLRLELHEGV
jgi:hypothetical protein